MTNIAKVTIFGGASGVGKSTVAYAVAKRFDRTICEIDDLQIGLRRMTTPVQQPILYYWHTHPEAFDWEPERILELHLQVCKVMSPMLEAVIENHCGDDAAPIVLEGDYVLPETAAKYALFNGLTGAKVRAVFLYESDEQQIVTNFRMREPDADEQTKRARVSWLYGQWLRTECAKYGIAAVESRPWETVLDRAIAALTTAG